jgi:hypothetical protein
MSGLGCEKNNPVYPVSGTVKFEGKPMVGGGSIALMPLANQEGMTAGGEIAADGTYKLSTYGTGDGSMPGEFRVLITQVTAQEPKNTEDGEAPEQAASTVGEADRIPEVYADPRNSPLTMKVEAISSNQIDLDLKRDGK